MAYDNKVIELLEKGLSAKEADIQANNWMKTKAALHAPDQVAGGNPNNVIGMGSKSINTSIGSQWKSRIGGLDDFVRNLAKGMSDEARKTTALDIKLTLK